tara:strand:- start:878 stop:1315 length:438 start_codon:yes stop_codon:yes gene_type:complete
MTSNQTLNTLNRLLAVHCQSLPLYLSQTTPWTRTGDEEAQQAMQLVVEDQTQLTQRLATMIVEDGGAPNRGVARDYTAMNDLSLEFLLGKVIDQLRQTIPDIEQCVADLSTAPMAKGLAEESLGMARGHLQSLEDIVQRMAGAGA